MVGFIIGLVIGGLAGFFIGGVYSADDKFFGPCKEDLND